MAEVARALSLVRSGSTYGTINRWIAALNLDTSHFSGLGSAWASAKFGTPSPGCKICWRCRQEKPLSAFHRRCDGYQPACKACRAELDLARRDRCACGNLKSHNRTRCQACRLSDVPDPRWEISDAEVAWVAGILEGEGCWTRRNSRARSNWWIAVRMTDKDIIYRLGSTTGIGRISPARPQTEHRKMAWAWQVSVRMHREWLTTAVWPWLGERRQARVWELWPEVEHAVFAQQAGHQSSKLAPTEFESPPPL